MRYIQLVFVLWLSFSMGYSAQVISPEPAPRYKDGKWGYADASGRFVIGPRFDAARPFVSEIAKVAVVDEELPEIDGRPNLKWGYVDRSGQVIVDLKYSVLGRFSEGLASAAMLDPKLKARRHFGGRGAALALRWGYVDRSGKVVIPLKFLDAGDFSEGLANVDAGDESDSLC